MEKDGRRDPVKEERGTRRGARGKKKKEAEPSFREGRMTRDEPE